MFDLYDVVKFDMRFDDELKHLEGYVFIIDELGTFEQDEEPSYDIYVAKLNCIIKHMRHSSLKYVRKPTAVEIRKVEAIR